MKQLMCSLGLLGSLLMSVTAWANVAPGEPAPAFRAADAASHPHTMTDYIGNWVVLEWLHPECEASRASYENGEIPSLQAELREEGVEWLTIVSSRPGPDNVLNEEEAMALAEEYESQASAPFLLDETSVVALAYGVETAPQFFLINPQGTVVYMGALRAEDSSESDHSYLKVAFEEATAGDSVTVPTTQPYGCELHD